MRLLVAVAVLAASCSGSPLPPAASASSPSPAKPACEARARPLSLTGQSAAHPRVAAGATGYAAAWEESSDERRMIVFQPFDAAGEPLGPATQVADLERGGAEPRVVADGDGFAISWTVDLDQTSQLLVERVDGRGGRRGEPVVAVDAPNARALALARVADGFALAWWTWAGAPPVQKLSFLDGDGRPRGTAIELAHGTVVEPAASLRAGKGGALEVAWEEQLDGVNHVIVGEVADGALARRIDVGPGDGPSLGRTLVVFADLGEGAVYAAPIGTAERRKLGDGALPATAVRDDGSVACLVRTVDGEDGPRDELRCREIVAGKAGPELVVARVPPGVVALSVAAGPRGRYAVVYQDGDAIAVGLATVRCPG
jgi:hypothetical protein